MTTIDEKIAKTKDSLEKAKARYDNVVDELENLLAKKKAIQTNEIYAAFSKSHKSYKDVLEF